jgi:hypothetical protein
VSAIPTRHPQTDVALSKGPRGKALWVRIAERWISLCEIGGRTRKTDPERQAAAAGTFAYRTAPQSPWETQP